MVIQPEIAFQRFLNERHNRRAKVYEHFIERVPVEDLPPEHLHRWIVDWANHQLSNIGVNSTGGVALPPLHFELVHVDNDMASAHTFEADEWDFIIMTRPMLDEMLGLSRQLVDGNPKFMAMQLAPLASRREISQLLLVMQFCLVLSHEYSHLARQHLDSDPPHGEALGHSLPQVQELDADGFGIYHHLAYFFHGDGRTLISQMLKISSAKHLQNSTLSAFLLAGMTQFCARWAGKVQVDADFGAKYPLHAVRIQHMILIAELWCKEVGMMSTEWMTDGTVEDYFSAASRLFPYKSKAGWDQQVSWLRSSWSERYRAEIRSGAELLRTGER
jgi:hypothetical protein